MKSSDKKKKIDIGIPKSINIVCICVAVLFGVFSFWYYDPTGIYDIAVSLISSVVVGFISYFMILIPATIVWTAYNGIRHIMHRLKKASPPNVEKHQEKVTLPANYVPASPQNSKLLEAFSRPDSESKYETSTPIVASTVPFPEPSRQPHTAAAPALDNLSSECRASLLELSGKIAEEKISVSTIKEIRSLKDYVVLDVETTGLSKACDQIIEIGILVVQDGKPAGQYEKLLNPGCHIPAAATKVNGITDEDVADCPSMFDVADTVWGVIDGKIVVGYNASFDVAFISRAMAVKGINGTIRYIDVLPLAKKAYKGLESYKLEAVAKSLGFNGTQKHRALDDAKLTYFVLNMAIQKMLQDHENEVRRKKAEQEREAAERAKKFGGSPMLNKTVAFTGDFQTDRHQLEAMLDKVGGVLKTSVTMKLDYLVVGDIQSLPEWALERKVKKADHYIERGCSIAKISEGEYVELIGRALKELK